MIRPTEQDLAGMSLSERLMACDLFEQWDDAVTAKNKDEMVSLLVETSLTERKAKQTAKAILADPSAYGF